MEATHDIATSAWIDVVLSYPDDIWHCISRKTSTLDWKMFCMTCHGTTSLISHEKYKPLRYPRFNITEKAARRGYTSVMKFGLELKHPYSKRTIKHAVLSRNRECFDAIPDGAFDFTIKSAIKAAATVGDAEIFDIILSKTTSFLAERWSHKAVHTEAVRRGHLHIVKKINMDGDDGTLVADAAYYGRKDIVEWALQRCVMLGRPVISEICFHITRTYPREEVVKGLDYFCKTFQIELDDTVLAAATFRNIPEIIAMFDADHKWSSSAYAAAAAFGWTQILKDAPNISDYLGHALVNNQLEVIKMIKPTYVNHQELARCKTHIIDYYLSLKGVVDIQKLSKYAYISKKLRTLEHLHRRGYSYSFDDGVILTFGKPRIVCWLFKNNIISKTLTLTYAAKFHNVELAIVVEPDPFEWPDSVYDTIVLFGTRSYSLYNYAVDCGAKYLLEKAQGRRKVMF